VSELKIVKVETYNRLDNIYLEVHCECDGETWVDNFAGQEWLQKDDNGQERFVARVIQNKKDADKQGIVSLDKLKQKYTNKVIEVVDNGIENK
jgi:hypothetical protein